MTNPTIETEVATVKENVRHNEKAIDKLDRDLNQFRAEVKDIRTPEDIAKRKKEIKNQRAIAASFHNLVFQKKLPVGIANIRQAVKKLALSSKKLTLKMLDAYNQYWHPKQRVPLDNYLSYGSLRGRYLPSSSNSGKGTLLLAKGKGFLPATLNQDLSDKIRANICSGKKYDFGCWLRSSKIKPYYEVVIASIKWQEALIKKSDRFLIRGKVVSQKGQLVTVRIRGNEPKHKKINFTLKIHRVKREYQKGDFVMFECNFHQGKLDCFRSVKID